MNLIANTTKEIGESCLSIMEVVLRNANVVVKKCMNFLRSITSTELERKKDIPRGMVTEYYGETDFRQDSKFYAIIVTALKVITGNALTQ